MNIYRTEFFANCPTNAVRIKYRLEIRTREVIPVEQIVARVEAVGDVYHEEIADELLSSFGGEQTLIAEHHGVTIETLRQAATMKLAEPPGLTDAQILACNNTAAEDQEFSPCITAPDEDLIAFARQVLLAAHGVDVPGEGKKHG